MNLISFVTLTKIIKIELCALHSIAQRSISTSRFWKAFTHLAEQIRAYYTECFEIDGYYKHEVNCLHFERIGDHGNDFVIDLPVIITRVYNPSLSMLVLQYLARFEIVCIEMLCFWFSMGLDPNSKLYKDVSLLDETIFYHKYDRYPVLYGFRHNSAIFTQSIFALTN